MSDRGTIQSPETHESSPSPNPPDSPPRDLQSSTRRLQSTDLQFSQITTSIPLRITFRNVIYSVPVKKKKKPWRELFRRGRKTEGGRGDVEASNQESRNIENNNVNNEEEEYLGGSRADEAAGLQGMSPWMALGGMLMEPAGSRPRREGVEREASEADTETDTSNTVHHGRKKILDGVSGVFKEGRLTAIIGSSGAGKTTLLALLAGDVSRNARLTGQVLVNDMDVTGSRKMKEISAFVFQDDLLLETMTVEEAIRQSLLLRSPPNMTEEEREARLQEALKMFRMKHAAKTAVGRPDKKGISGGERKRTAIAMDVAINPSVLFLDEPTSGLDTYTAFIVIKILHCLTRRGHTVVTTIHQPSSEIFHLFDDLLILAHGKIMYLGEASKSVDYFARLGYQCPSYTNPADFFFMEVIQGTIMVVLIHPLGVDVAMLEERDEESEVRESTGRGRPIDPDSVKMKRLLSAWKESPENASIQALVIAPPTTLVTQYRHTAPFPRQFQYLLGRASKNAIRNPLIIRVRIIQTLVVALFVGLSFVNLNRLTPQQQIQDKAGVIFFMALNQFFASAISVMTIFAVEKYVFFREYGAGYYGLTAYYLSKVLVEVRIAVYTTFTPIALFPPPLDSLPDHLSCIVHSDYLLPRGIEPTI